MLKTRNRFIGKIFKVLNHSYLIKAWVIALFSISFIILIIVIFFLRKRTKNKIKIASKKEIVPPKLIITEAPTVFFHNRFVDAFPGFSNGYEWFDSSKEIRNRLKILLADPIVFDETTRHNVERTPIWWFRQSSAMGIDNFKLLKKGKVLINIDELIIEKIAAYRGRRYYEDFVYIQCLPDKPTGLYKIDEKYLNSCINEGKDYKEEYGLFKNRFISRQEFDDDSALINGKPTRTTGAELRSRSLAKYNFIIAAKYSPYNCIGFSRNKDGYFNKLLTGELKFDDFVCWMQEFPKNANDN